MRNQHLFIVRVWQEPGEVSQWRGSVEHVPTQKRFYFSSLSALAVFIATQVDNDDSSDASLFAL